MDKSYVWMSNSVCISVQIAIYSTWEEQSPNTSLGGSRQRVLQIRTFETLGAIKLYWNISVCFAKVGTFEGNNPLSPNRAEILFNGLSGQCGFTHQEIVMFTIANIIQLRLFGKYMA